VKVDPFGNLWFGTMRCDSSLPVGSLYSMTRKTFNSHPTGSVPPPPRTPSPSPTATHTHPPHPLQPSPPAKSRPPQPPPHPHPPPPLDIWISNGLGWSPDASQMYFTDSTPRTISAFDFAPDGPALANRRAFVTPPPGGEPDGLTVDAEGGVWSCMWDGARIERYDAAGGGVETVRVGVTRPTSCCFGGGDLTTLFVTSASIDVGGEDDGRVLVFERAGVGLPPNKFVL
jgi:sugar lactone lactonase YvrE